MTDAAIEIAGETMRCLPERALYWPRGRTLFVADPHFGKAATFRAAGVPVPGGTTADGLQRLDGILGRMDVARVVFLGDFLHAREGRVEGTIALLREWCERQRDRTLLLVRGNHDRGAGDPPAELCIQCVDAPRLEPPFVLHHHPSESDEGYTLAGHLHPGARLSGAARDRSRLPCFWVRTTMLVLPAFGDFTGLWNIEPEPGDRVLVVAGEEVIPVAAA
jgi:DNA ligase-associated metallophosphoesterase